MTEDPYRESKERQMGGFVGEPAPKMSWTEAIAATQRADRARAAEPSNMPPVQPYTKPIEPLLPTVVGQPFTARVLGMAPCGAGVMLAREDGVFYIIHDDDKGWLMEKIEPLYVDDSGNPVGTKLL